MLQVNNTIFDQAEYAIAYTKSFKLQGEAIPPNFFKFFARQITIFWRHSSCVPIG